MRGNATFECPKTMSRKLPIAQKLRCSPMNKRVKANWTRGNGQSPILHVLRSRVAPSSQPLGCRRPRKWVRTNQFVCCASVALLLRLCCGSDLDFVSYLPRCCGCCGSGGGREGVIAIELRISSKIRMYNVNTFVH